MRRDGVSEGKTGLGGVDSGQTLGEVLWDGRRG